MNDSFTIAKAADAASVGVETIRYYERRGLIPQPTHKVGAYRRYDSAHIARIRCIKRAQELGFTLEEIESLLRLQDGVNRTEIQEIASARLTQIRERIEGLQRIELTLSHLLKHCRTSAAPKCPITEALTVDGTAGRRAARPKKLPTAP